MAREWRRTSSGDGVDDATGDDKVVGGIERARKASAGEDKADGLRKERSSEYRTRPPPPLVGVGGGMRVRETGGRGVGRARAGTRGHGTRQAEHKRPRRGQQEKGKESSRLLFVQPLSAERRAPTVRHGERISDEPQLLIDEMVSCAAASAKRRIPSRRR